MPWPTTHGLRILEGEEADLIRGAIGMMVDTHVAELRDGCEAWGSGVDWFDQWDTRQRLWLLEQVTRAMLGHHVLEEPAAVFDAAADAVFHELIDLVRIELGEESEIETPSDPPRSWRQSIRRAEQSTADDAMTPMSSDRDWDQLEYWVRQINRLADSILGVRLYRKAESFRDGDYEQTKRFLRERGLPPRYLEFIPPLRSIDQTQLSIDRIQAYVFRDS
ncbi:MAG: hypothetical protein AAGJ83_14010 [Planctomycetota bacterium]